ncbi:MAG: HD domain-containing protein, partial [Gammaproteobacteria bacterium]|nr:HD domain-containing protein [Gammaproteobacteria bacterium]
ELERLYGVPQPEKHHPEIDTGIHTMMVLTQAAKLSDDTRVRFAALVHDLGKGTTPKDEWPRHHAHEHRGVKLIDALCERFRIPKDYRDLAKLVGRYHSVYHRAEELKASTLLDTLEALDVFRRPERLELFLLACEADSRGRTGFEKQFFLQPGIFRKAFDAALKVTTQELIEKGFSGKELGEQLHQVRVKAIKEVI